MSSVNEAAVLDSSSQPQTFGDLPDEVSAHPKLEHLQDVRIPRALREPTDEGALDHREFDDSDFWRRIPAFRDVTEEEFLDWRFQSSNSVTSVEQLAEALGDAVADGFLDDVRRGMARAPMSVRISPYILSLIDWKNPTGDRLVTQFLPIGSRQLPNHPRVTLDSLHEQRDSPLPGLVHRYPDKVLFLPLDVCPVYCRFCTRSYAIGTDTDAVEKVDYKPNQKRWRAAYAYVASRPEIEDIVVSGGDTYMLPAKLLRGIVESLLAIPHVRRIRLATKGPAVMPMKILSDDAWTSTVLELAEQGRKLGKEVCLHTHFNSTAEITDISRRAMRRLFSGGLTVRNQSVMIRGVNDDPEEMVRLVRQLSWMNVQPYYVYQHDMVERVEDLRTRVADTEEVERHVRGATAGFNTPTFVNDVPGGGGKRDVHSYDHYDRTTGVSVYRSPAVDEEKLYLYFDPIHLLPEEGRERWADPDQHARIVDEALEAARARQADA